VQAIERSGTKFAPAAPTPSMGETMICQKLARLPLAAAMLCVITAIACSGGDDAATTTAADSMATAAPCPGDNAGLQLPDGFCATVFADSVGDARHVVVSSDGVVYVTLEGTAPSPEKKVAGDTQEPQAAAALALRDTNGDGRADTIARIGTRGNTGIGLYNGYLYVDEGESIVRYKRNNGELAPSGSAEVVVSGIPLNPGHRARNFAIDSSGSLFVNVGSATNNCQKQDRQAGSPGVDPCTELNTRAGVWRFDANRTNQSFTPQNRFATGLRNAMGLRIGPDGKLYTTMHGRDQLTDNWREVFPDPKYQAENPGEEFMQVNEGDDFGWPYCYWSVDQKKLVTAPEYGGDGTKSDRCTDFKTPLAVWPGHWAPMSTEFYTGSMFPEQYRNGVFIAFHGSWNRLPLPQEGYRVVFQPMNGGSMSGDSTSFALGFVAGIDPTTLPGSAPHRPTGLAQGPDGALYVTDDQGGRIYRITYGGTAGK
jgi:glucose/arabinose dehydrogenase